jgi:PHD/YefM family antitoxin component YafN of YafNO toxin-antitoxin module
MKQNQLDRIIKLVRRTGDRFVIMDKETEEVMVMMNLSEYEILLNDTTPVEDLEEEEMLDKLNHDISRWREQKKPSPVDDWSQPTIEEDEEFSEVKSEMEDNELTDISNLEPLESEPKLVPIVEKEPELANITLQETPVQPVFGQEDLSDLPEGEEEKFYLEPIE